MNRKQIAWSFAGVLLLSLLLWGPAPRASAAENFAELSAAIQAINGNGSGAITLSGDIILPAPLPSITGRLTIYGSGYRISGDGKHRIFDMSGGRLTLNNVTLTEGKAPEGEYGGAIRMRNGAELVAENVAFTNNSAKWGGAIMMFGSSTRLTVRRSSFAGNRAKEYAGAIYANGDARISSSSFVENVASDSGGALVVSNANLDVSNSTFHNNLASHDGGGVFVLSGEVTLTHVTMTGNRLSSGSNIAGSALAKQAFLGTEGPVRLRNSIVVGDAAFPTCAGGLDEMVGNLSPDGTCSLKPGADPLLDEATGSPAYRALKDRSPAVDAGDPAYCLEADQIGTARPRGGGCDIGAIESTTARPAVAPIVPPPPCPLADQIIAANTDAPSGGCRAGSGHDTIVLDADIELSAPLPVITSEITIEGRGHTIDGGRAYRIFDIDRGSLTVSDLTLSNGVGSEFGGAIRLQNGGQAIINNSRFINNYSPEGGAIGMMFTNWVTINNSAFLRNRATNRGGAISMNGGGTVNIRSSSFVKNRAGKGGAIGTFSGNVSVSNSSFISNRGGKGGALYAGGAQSPGGVTVTLTHVTMLNNEATRGTGIHIDEDRATQVALSMRNSVIAGLNERGTALCSGRLAQNIRNLIQDDSCPSQLTDDAQFEEPSDGATYVSPLPGSPMIRTADPRFCPETDQIGRPRALVGPCDIGAIESIPVRRALTDCAVTTTHALNFREQPGGTRFGSVPEKSTVRATARTAGWFQVEYHGAAGWISADYVKTEGECG